MQRKTTNKLNLLALRRQYTNPYELYDTLRERDCIYFDETSQCWLVTGHNATTLMLDDPRFLSSLGSAANGSSTQMSSVSRQMLFMDGEHHQHAQDVMLRPLAQMVKQMPSDIRIFARDAIKAVQAKRDMDVVNEFASPISLFAIAQVLGMSTHDKQQLRQLEHWSDVFGDVTSGYFHSEMQDIKNLEEYFRDLIGEKKRHPSDDLLSAFAQAENIFPEEEDIVANCMMVFAAGRITTKKLLGNGISLLMPRWKEFRAEAQANPRFIKQLGEELLRRVTPTRYLIREASEDIDLSSLFAGNHLIRRGQRMLLFLEAANHDPSLFSQPASFDPHRRPNKHIAFGYGPHQCPGATLARVEIQVALEELFSLSDIRPKPYTTPTWNPNPNLGGFISNPISFSLPQ
jgi:cytochrome P450